MSVSSLPESISAYALGMQSRAIDVTKRKLDDALVRYDAWFLIFVAIILALGATLMTGMSIWCVVKQHKTFTGSWSFRNYGLKVYFECR